MLAVDVAQKLRLAGVADAGNRLWTVTPFLGVGKERAFAMRT